MTQSNQTQQQTGCAFRMFVDQRGGKVDQPFRPLPPMSLLVVLGQVEKIGQRHAIAGRGYMVSDVLDLGYQRVVPAVTKKVRAARLVPE